MERGDHEPRDDEYKCVSNSKVTADTPQTEHQPESTDTPGVPGPHTHCMPIVSSSFVLFALIVSSRRAMYKKTSFHVEGQSPSNKSVLEPTTSLVGPARCLSYSTRFQWRPNESGTVLLHDSLCLWGEKPFTRTGFEKLPQSPSPAEPSVGPCGSQGLARDVRSPSRALKPALGGSDEVST